jgi:hypothetical protein
MSHGRQHGSANVYKKKGSKSGFTMGQLCLYLSTIRET